MNAIDRLPIDEIRRRAQALGPWFHNIDLNGVGDRALPVHGRAEQMVAAPADLLIANIHYDVMRQFLTAPGFRTKRHWILSGLLRSQARTVEKRIAEAGGCIVKRWTRDHIWYTYLGYNRCH